MTDLIYFPVNLLAPILAHKKGFTDEQYLEQDLFQRQMDNAVINAVKSGQLVIYDSLGFKYTVPKAVANLSLSSFQTTLDDANNWLGENPAMPKITQKDIPEAVVTESKVECPVVDNQTLLDEKISTLIKRFKLDELDDYEFCFELYAWQEQLEKEKKSCRGEYPNKRDYDERISLINQKLAEIETELNNRTLDSEDSQPRKNSNIQERELTTWLRETWIAEEKPGGTVFFNKLRKYVNKPSSPIRGHFSASTDGAGISWQTGNYSGEMSKKTIQNKVSVFKKESCQSR